MIVGRSCCCVFGTVRNSRDLVAAWYCVFKRKVARCHNTCSGKGATVSVDSSTAPDFKSTSDSRYFSPSSILPTMSPERGLSAAARTLSGCLHWHVRHSTRSRIRIDCVTDSSQRHFQQLGTHVISVPIGQRRRLAGDDACESLVAKDILCQQVRESLSTLCIW